MAMPARNVLVVHETTIEDMRDAFLVRSRAKNLSVRTIQWYERHTKDFVAWCDESGVMLATQLRRAHLDDYLVALQDAGMSPHTTRGAAQVIKSLARFGIRNGCVSDEVTRDFKLPRVPKVIIETFDDDQLRRLLEAPDLRRWVGVRDRAILALFLDTMARVSEISGLAVQDVDIPGRSIRVMGKGRKERDIPFGQVTSQAMQRYVRTVKDVQPSDPFFISYRGKPLPREVLAEIVRSYGKRADIRGVRCSPHTIRHTGAKRFIMNGGDVFSLQKILGHETMVMVRRYVELANVDVRLQHERFGPTDSLLRRPRPSE